jgi:glycosyltransferase involved in cell wall biosynthesis
VEFIGEVDEKGKDELLGGAYAYVFPIDWPEPFGLTMIEAMATGTPVIAMARGSVPEVVADGETGFVCRTIDEMVAAVERAGDIDRGACRQRVEQLFTASRMADGYEEVYRRLLDNEMKATRRPLGAASGDSSRTQCHLSPMKSLPD